MRLIFKGDSAMPTKLERLYDEFGQSLWYDNISRDLLNAGDIQSLVDQGVRGLTSNPSIFKKAITSGSAYDAQLQELVGEDASPEAIYEALAIKDIRHAADILRPIYETSGRKDGFVSLEVSPLLAHETEDTIAEAIRLFETVDRPNLMIKIPGTPEGLPAIETCIARGLNINITLLFSCEVYSRVVDAYFAGLEQRAERGERIDGIGSVASFFVSRVDTLVDNLLDEKIAGASGGEKAELESLKGKAGIANAKLAYLIFKERFNSPQWHALAEKGAKLQRVLWASTSTKNPAYSDVLYVDNLIGPHTVNTAPPATIEAFLDHGKLANQLDGGYDEAQQVIDGLAAHGIDMDEVTDQLLAEGVDKFEKPFNALIDAIAEKAGTMAAPAAD
jgi:transaldolase